MADEIGEAYERLLAFLPEETRAMLGNAKHILGMTQLVAENAKRCGVEVRGDDWDWGLGNEWWDEAWSICGIDFTISEPDDRDPWTAVPRRGSKPKIEVADDPAGEWTPNFWHCGPPLFTGVPPCGQVPLG